MEQLSIEEIRAYNDFVDCILFKIRKCKTAEEARGIIGDIQASLNTARIDHISQKLAEI